MFNTSMNHTMFVNIYCHLRTFPSHQCQPVQRLLMRRSRGLCTEMKNGRHAITISTIVAIHCYTRNII